jgi:hypothetical protein
MAIFLAATMFLLASAAAPSILNQGRREREQQLIWRGNQYVRGIRLYFQKNGRFPQTMEELQRGSLDVHFLRKAFTDPMNTADPDWRVIYVAPSGQLIGSVHHRSLQEMAAALGGAIPPTGNLAAALGMGQPAAQAGGGGAAQTGQPGAGRGGAPAAPGAGRGAQPATGTQPAGGLGQPSFPAPLEAVEGPVLGASMIGVASKVKRPSLMVYQGKDTYFDWEFIWNPLLGGVIGAPPAALQPGTGQPPPGTAPDAAAPPGQPEPPGQQQPPQP